MVSYRKNVYNILYRLKGSDGPWYPYYSRRYSQEVIKRKYDRLVSFESPFVFLIVSEPAD